MSDDALRMKAGIDYDPSGLAKLRADMARIGNLPGAAAVKRDFEAIKGSVAKVSAEIRSSLNPAFAAMGIGSLGVAGAIAGTIAAVKSLTTGLTQLRMTSKETGASVNELRQLESLGKRFDIDPTQMTAGVAALSDRMREIKNRVGETYEWLRTASPETAKLLGGLFNAKDMDEALETALRGLAGIQNPKVRQMIAEKLFGSRLFSQLGSEGLKTFLDAREDIQKRLKALPPDADRIAREYKEALDRMSESTVNFQTEIAKALLPLLPKVTKGIEAFTDLLRDEKSEVSKFLRELTSGVQNVDMTKLVTDVKDVVVGLKDMGVSVNSAVQGLGGWKTVIEALIALKIIGLTGRILGLTTALGGLAAVRAPAWVLGLLGISGGTAAAVAGGALAGIGLGKAAVAVGGVAAGKYWQPKNEDEVADLRRQREEIAGQIAGIEGRLHPSMRGNPNPEIDRLRTILQDLDNRIAAGPPTGEKSASGVPLIQKQSFDTAFPGLRGLVQRAAYGDDIGDRQGRHEDAGERRRQGDQSIIAMKRLTEELDGLRRDLGGAGGGLATGPGGGLGGLIQSAALGRGYGRGGGGGGGGGGYGADGGGRGITGPRPPMPGRGGMDQVRRGVGGGGDGTRSGAGVRGANGSPAIGRWWTDERQQHAIDRLVAGGVSELGARALVARWAAVEAPGGPASVNRGSGAFGIAQWLTPSRKRPIAGNVDFDAQIDHTIKELHDPKEGLPALRQLNRARTAIEAAIGASMFERAEGYNGRTGVDNFTGKTAAAMDQLVGGARARIRSAIKTARRDSSANRVFPPVRTLRDWSDASGATPLRYPNGWNAGVNSAAVARPVPDMSAPPHWFGRAAKALGSGPAKVEGAASIDVNFTGLPRGARTSTDMSGMFKEINTNRGRAMEPTDI